MLKNTRAFWTNLSSEDKKLVVKGAVAVVAANAVAMVLIAASNKKMCAELDAAEAAEYTD